MDANPVALVVAAIAGLVLGVIICYKKFETFRDTVNKALHVVSEVIYQFVDKQLWLFQKMAEGMSHIPIIGGAFKPAVHAIQMVRDKLKSLNDAVQSLPTEKTIDVALRVRAQADAAYHALGYQGPSAMSGVVSQVNKVATSNYNAGGYAGPAVSGKRASGGPVSGGNTYLVGEHGPELVTMGQSGFVSNASATAKMFGAIGKVSDSTTALQKTAHTQKTQYDNAARRYHQLLARPQKTQAEKDALVNAKANMDQQKKDYDAATKAVTAAQKADKALQAQYKKGGPLLTKAAGLVGFTNVVGPVEKQANALADQIHKQFADKDGNIPEAAQAAIDRLNTLASDAASARNGLISSLTGSSDFVSKFSGQGASSGDISAFLQGQVTKIKRLGSDLKILTARGLPPSMIQQLAAGGLDALSIADALASAPSADLAGIVAAQSQINTLSNALGDSTEAAVFGKPDSPTGDLTGTKIKDAPAGTVNNINITAQTNASAAQIAADAAWHLRTVSA